mgnify:CR=1 FL=1
MKYLHTMVRVTDVEASLRFYRDALGLEVLSRRDVPQGRFTLIFLAAPGDSSAQIELTHNWGTEADDTARYHNGNDEPRGFGHIGISVPDVYEACARLDTLGVDYVKRPDDGSMKGLAFIKDPDGYWIELITKTKWQVTE